MAAWISHVSHIATAMRYLDVFPRGNFADERWSTKTETQAAAMQWRPSGDCTLVDICWMS